MTRGIDIWPPYFENINDVKNNSYKENVKFNIRDKVRFLICNKAYTGTIDEIMIDIAAPTKELSEVKYIVYYRASFNDYRYIALRKNDAIVKYEKPKWLIDLNFL